MKLSKSDNVKTGKNGTASGPGAVPPGEYSATVLAAESGNSKAGDPMLTLTLGVKVKDKVRQIRYWAPVGTSFMDKLVEAFGEVDSDELPGRECFVEVIADTYNGKPSPKVDRIWTEDDGDDDF